MNIESICPSSGHRKFDDPVAVPSRSGGNNVWVLLRNEGRARLLGKAWCVACGDLLTETVNEYISLTSASPIYTSFAHYHVGCLPDDAPIDSDGFRRQESNRERGPQ